MLKTLLNLLWRRNPVTRIVYSQAPTGMKIIGLSLVLLLAGAVPFALYWLWQPQEIPYWTGIVFAGTASLAHMGFVVGLIYLIWDMFRR